MYVVHYARTPSPRARLVPARQAALEARGPLVSSPRTIRRIHHDPCYAQSTLPDLVPCTMPLACRLRHCCPLDLVCVPFLCCMSHVLCCMLSVFGRPPQCPMLHAACCVSHVPSRISSRCVCSKRSRRLVGVRDSIQTSGVPTSLRMSPARTRICQRLRRAHNRSRSGARLDEAVESVLDAVDIICTPCVKVPLDWQVMEHGPQTLLSGMRAKRSSGVSVKGDQPTEPRCKNRRTESHRHAAELAS